MDILKYRPHLSWRQGLLIVLALCFAIYVDFIQALPLAFSQQISTQFNLSFAQFNQLISAFEAPFIFLLLFFGFIADMLGAKKSILLTFVLLVVANYLFSHTTNINMLVSSRFVMGIGSLLATVSILILFAQQLPRSVFCVVVGLLLAITTLAKFFGVDIHLFLHQESWVQSANVLSIVGIILFGLFLFAPRGITEATRTRPNIDDIVATLTNRNIWLSGLIAACGYLFAYLFLSIIGPGFLANTNYFNQIEIENIFSYGVFSLAAGLLLIGKLGYFIPNHRKLLQSCYAIAAISFAVTLLFIQHYSLDLILLCITSFMAAAYVLTYAIANQNSRRLCLGTAFSIIFILIYLGSLLSDIVMQFAAMMLPSAANNTLLWWLIISIIPILFFIGILLASQLTPPPSHSAGTTPSFYTQFVAFWTHGGPLGRAFWIISILGSLFVGSLVLTLVAPFDALLPSNWSAAAISQLVRVLYLCSAIVCIVRAYPQPNTWRMAKITALVFVSCFTVATLLSFLGNIGMISIW